MLKFAKQKYASAMGAVVAFGLSLLAATELVYGYRYSVPFSRQSAAELLLPDARIFTNSEDVSGIYGALFGVQAPDVQPAVMTTPLIAPPPPPMPRFVLTGVLSGANGMAVMLDPSGREQMYRVGEILPGGARLESVMGNAVQISMGGVSQIIRIEWEGTHNAGGDLLQSGVTEVAPPAVYSSDNTTQQ